jgi:monomeric phenylalanine-4-hydroxylase
MILEQQYQSYTSVEHNTWAELFERQSKTILQTAAAEFKKGFALLSFDPYKVADLSIVNKILRPASGWSVIPAPGLVSNRNFFSMLIHKQFPVTVTMRKPEEIAFSELPDIFHDVYGHVPMLMNSMFCEFMTKYSDMAINYSEDDAIVACFGRLYWFTMEMGLIKEDDELKPFGGAILTSSGEIENIRKPMVPKYPFNIDQVINTEYDNFQLQKEYFYINSFYDLFKSLNDIGPCIDKMLVGKI